MYIYLMTLNILLSHPETRRVLVTVLWAVGLRWVQSSILSIITITLFNHLSPNSIPPLRFMFWYLFCFMFLFLFASSFLFYFQYLSPNPDPDICPILLTLICSLWYLYIPNLMYVPQSEINIDCPSNSSSEPPNPCLSFVWNSRTVDMWWRST